jgi:phage baseplate assembly protein gpV
MRTPKIGLILPVLALAGVAFWGCSGSVRYQKTTPVVVEKDDHGPPPHAPAHGYRHKHPDGVVLVYDSGLGLYVVSGHKNVYYSEGRYYRYHQDVWESATHFDGKWKKTSSKKLPPGLQDKQVAKGNKKGKKG